MNSKTAVLFGLASLAIIGWILAEVIGMFNPKMAGMIKLMVPLLAIGTVLATIISIFGQIKSFANGLM